MFNHWGQATISKVVSSKQSLASVATEFVVGKSTAYDCRTKASFKLFTLTLKT